VRAAVAKADATLNDQRFVQAIAAAATDCLLRPRLPPPRMAWITTWNVRCGVAEYSRHLLSAWPHDIAGEVVVLADDRTEPVSDLTTDTHRPRIAWRLGLPMNSAGLAKIVAQEDPQIVVIQHQPALLDWPMLASLLRTEALSRRIVTVTLHNTQHLSDTNPDIRADVIDALRGVARVIVHGAGDLERLTGAGLFGNLVLMPHGVPPPAEASAEIITRPLPADSGPVVGCYGFFLPGKGIAQLIEAAAALRTTWPKLRLRLVNAAYDTPDSEAEIATCRRLAEAEGIADAIEWHTTFLPEGESRALLQGCDLVVLPYQSSRESSSAALRSVLSARVPVMATPLPVFDDAEVAIARLAGFDAEAIAEGVTALLHDTAHRETLLASATAFAEARQWKLVAERMQGMLEGLVNSPATLPRPVDG
jgi:glycosyltransferase involved in cell wall biosynthesis